MKTSQKFALFLGTVAMIAGAGFSFAQMAAPPDGPMQGLMRGHERTADRLLRQFDTNHDGKITHDEMNRALYAQFTAATHGARLMTQDQFSALRAGEARQHAMEIFRRMDWNGDGKLSLEDYAAPQRARFMTMDKAGTGTISCAVAKQSSFRKNTAVEPPGGWGESRRLRPAANRAVRGGFGLSAFCAENDLNMDGVVTRPELDIAIGKRFALAAHGAATMTMDQFVAAEAQRFDALNAKAFKRLDKDGDGKLSLAEFAAPELRLFTRLDRNKDGVLTGDELRTSPRTSNGRAAKSRRMGPHR